MKSARFLIRPLSCLTILLLASGCGGSALVLPGISNQGILPLSPSDPQLGANLFLSREMQKSGELYNFIKTRGAPRAVRVDEPTVGRPVMQLFYPQAKEYYSAELFLNDTLRQWVVRGPFAIERQDYREVSALAHDDSALLALGSKTQRFSGVQAESEQSVHNGKESEHVVEAPLPPIPPPAPKKKVVKASKSESGAAVESKDGKKEVAISSENLPFTNFTTLNFDQRALLITQGFAEHDSNGDIMHTVRNEAETLAKIVEWYCGSLAPLGEVRTVNAIPEGSNALVAGQRIRVPTALIKRRKLLPAS